MHTYSVVGNTNEHQVTIGETTWGGREALWDTVGIDYGSLIYIALERSKTAREASHSSTNMAMRLKVSLSLSATLMRYGSWI